MSVNDVFGISKYVSAGYQMSEFVAPCIERLRDRGSRRLLTAVGLCVGFLLARWLCPACLQRQVKMQLAVMLMKMRPLKAARRRGSPR